MRASSLTKLSSNSSRATEEVANAMESLATRTVGQADQSIYYRDNLECVNLGIIIYQINYCG